MGAEAILIFAGITWLIFLLALGKHRSLKKRCTVKVQATCIKRVPRFTPPGFGRGAQFIATWEYQFQGKAVTVEDEGAAAYDPPGAVREFLIDPEFPCEYFVEESNIWLILLGIMTGLVTVTAVPVLVISLLQK